MPRIENLPNYPTREQVQADITHRGAEIGFAIGMGIATALGAYHLTPDAVPEKIAYWTEADTLEDAENSAKKCFTGTDLAVPNPVFKLSDWCITITADALDTSGQDVVARGATDPGGLHQDVHEAYDVAQNAMEDKQRSIRTRIALVAGALGTAAGGALVFMTKNHVGQNIQGMRNAAINDEGAEEKRAKKRQEEAEKRAAMTPEERREADYKAHEAALASFDANLHMFKKNKSAAKRIKAQRSAYLEWFYTRDIDYEPTDREQSRREQWAAFAESRDAQEAVRQERRAQRRAHGSRAQRAARAFRPRWYRGDQPGQHITPDHDAQLAPRPQGPGLTSMFTNDAGERLSDVRLAERTQRLQTEEETAIADQNLKDLVVDAQQHSVQATRDITDTDVGTQDPSII